ncbi:MAG: M15 family metallopeptidase [Pseudomonadota bacterium]
MKLGLFCAWAAMAGLGFLLGCAPSAPRKPAALPAQQTEAEAQAAARLARYPSVQGVRGNTVLFTDGATLPFSDGQAKSLAQKLEQADIADHFAQTYPAFAPIVAPAPDADPGRFRNDAFLKKLYGATRQEIEGNLVVVEWMPLHSGKELRFNRNQGAAEQLRKVSRELDQLPAPFMKYLVNIDSTYEYRPILGATRLSPHSYGIAIDLEVKYTCYWLWDPQYNYRNEIPKEIVDIFERYGFVWGGRWHHYDTMHFEYRPELFAQVW